MLESIFDAAIRDEPEQRHDDKNKLRYPRLGGALMIRPARQ
jgi:hypothetical protein